MNIYKNHEISNVQVHPRLWRLSNYIVIQSLKHYKENENKILNRHWNLNGLLFNMPYISNLNSQ